MDLGGFERGLSISFPVVIGILYSINLTFTCTPATRLSNRLLESKVGVILCENLFIFFLTMQCKFESRSIFMSVSVNLR